jgi:hypothetical protein
MVEALGVLHTAADRFQFDLTIEDGDRSHTVSIAEEAAPPELKALLAWLQKNLKA